MVHPTVDSNHVSMSACNWAGSYGSQRSLSKLTLEWAWPHGTSYHWLYIPCFFLRHGGHYWILHNWRWRSASISSRFKKPTVVMHSSRLISMALLLVVDFKGAIFHPKNEWTTKFLNSNKACTMKLCSGGCGQQSENKKNHEIRLKSLKFYHKNFVRRQNQDLLKYLNNENLACIKRNCHF